MQSPRIPRVLGFRRTYKLQPSLPFRRIGKRGLTRLPSVKRLQWRPPVCLGETMSRPKACYSAG
jgi:hypothetical protein